MVRHSSLRPDGDELGRAIAEQSLPIGRLMLTADGLMPGDVDCWHVDEVVRRIIRQGVDPVAAVTMATLHPAEYLGLDAHLGSVAAGRCADLLVLDRLRDFVPGAVVCDGRILADGRRIDDGIDWAAMRLPMVPQHSTPTRSSKSAAPGPHCTCGARSPGSIQRPPPTIPVGS